MWLCICVIGNDQLWLCRCVYGGLNCGCGDMFTRKCEWSCVVVFMGG